MRRERSVRVEVRLGVGYKFTSKSFCRPLVVINPRGGLLILKAGFFLLVQQLLLRLLDRRGRQSFSSAKVTLVANYNDFDVLLTLLLDQVYPLFQLRERSSISQVEHKQYARNFPEYLGW